MDNPGKFSVILSNLIKMPVKLQPIHFEQGQ
uniref:Uncharacterized protein n=1 Tax=Ralstonia solanacearum TaxID=305 RepID=A0A0S4WAX8_RALSL|nr:protein of unknown function [Ralstonia solanacearum]CUV43893.1 protein of unknown function [Ralstonia solanacearum]